MGNLKDNKPWDIHNLTNRFPEFMYENQVFEEFVEWLRRYNLTAQQKVRIYGLDIFGIISTLNFLLYNLPNQKDLIQRILNVWENFNPQEYNYGYSGQSVENEVKQLQFTGDFFLDQAIALVKEGEEYYRVKAQGENQG